MKIVVLTGSPHRHGTSALLADEFIRGAKESGHEVFRFDAAFETVHPCIGCMKCEYGKNPCVFQDSMNLLNPHLLDCELIVLVSPLYYYGFSAQIKAVIDRLQTVVFQIQNNRKCMLMAASYADLDWTMDGLVGHYKALVRYMGWADIGTILATGCGDRADIEASDYPKQAYEAGKDLT